MGGHKGVPEGDAAWALRDTGRGVDGRRSSCGPSVERASAFGGRRSAPIQLRHGATATSRLGRRWHPLDAYPVFTAWVLSDAAPGYVYGAGPSPGGVGRSPCGELAVRRRVTWPFVVDRGWGCVPRGDVWARYRLGRRGPLGRTRFTPVVPPAPTSPFSAPTSWWPPSLPQPPPPGSQGRRGDAGRFPTLRHRRRRPLASRYVPSTPVSIGRRRLLLRPRRNRPEGWGPTRSSRQEPQPAPTQAHSTSPKPDTTHARYPPPPTCVPSLSRGGKAQRDAPSKLCRASTASWGAAVSASPL